MRVDTKQAACIGKFGWFTRLGFEQETIGQMHPDFFQQVPFAGDPIEVANQQQAEQHFGVKRGAPSRTIEALQPFSYEAQIDSDPGVGEGGLRVSGFSGSSRTTTRNVIVCTEQIAGRPEREGP